MTVALIPSIEDKENLKLELNISTTLGISASQAKRKVARFFMDEVSMFIGPDPPLLVINKGEQIFWRFPIIFSMGFPGRKIGEVDVDAFTGQLIIDDELIAIIKANAKHVALNTAAPLLTVG